MVRLVVLKERCFIDVLKPKLKNSSLLRYTINITYQCQTIVKLHGVFLSNNE